MDVKAIREERGWTQAQLGDYLGIDRSSVSRMESGGPISGPVTRLLKNLASEPTPKRGKSSGNYAARVAQ